MKRGSPHDGDHSRLLALAKLLDVPLAELLDLDPIVASEMLVAERCKLIPAEMRGNDRPPHQTYTPTTLRKIGKKAMCRSTARSRQSEGGRKGNFGWK